MLSQCGVPRLLLVIPTPGAHWALFVLSLEGVIWFVMFISSESNCHTNTLSADIHFCLSLLGSQTPACESRHLNETDTY